MRNRMRAKTRVSVDLPTVETRSTSVAYARTENSSATYADASRRRSTRMVGVRYVTG